MFRWWVSDMDNCKLQKCLKGEKMMSRGKGVGVEFGQSQKLFASRALTTRGLFRIIFLTQGREKQKYLWNDKDDNFN